MRQIYRRKGVGDAAVVAAAPVDGEANEVELRSPVTLDEIAALAAQG